MPNPTVYLWREGEDYQHWRPTTLTKEGKDEAFLEKVIADRPDLLGLESLRTGIYGPFIPFRQVRLTTPQGRSVRPDIVLLTASGHVVIVEVKLSDNPELRDRSVIAQVIDYATSFAAMKPEELLSLFGSEPAAVDSWPALAASLFPNMDDARELGDLLVRRFRDGEVQLVVACDHEPIGLREMVDGIASQSALSFGFSVVELRPYISDAGRNGILFFQNTTVDTKIVNRTAVTVTIERGSPEPGVTVAVMGAKEVECAIEKVRRRGSRTVEPTIVDDATVQLQSVVADLIAKGQLAAPECKSGHKINCDLSTDKTGEVYLQVNYFDMAPGGPNQKNKAGKVRVRFLTKPRGDESSSARGARSQVLKRLLVEETEPFEKMIGTQVEAIRPTHGVGWMVPSSAVPQPWTPETLAGWTAKVFRHFLERLPLRAGKAETGVDEEESGADEEDDN